MDYKKKYENALEIGKSLIRRTDGTFHRKDLEDMFSELAESEDEKIMKAISDIIHLDNNEIRSVLDLHNISYQDAWDWFEKQYEQKPNKCMYSEYNYTDKDRKVLCDGCEEDCEFKQKPVEMIQWTGENLIDVINFTGKSPNFDKWFNSFDEYENYVHNHNNIFKLFNDDGSHYEVPVGAWIVRTPDGYNVASQFRFQQKPVEWSEEQIKALYQGNQMTMKTIYISGPITDLTTGQPREGWQQDFLDAEAKLRRMGFSVINPVDIAREVEEEWQQQWTLAGDMNKWNGPIANAFLKQGPTRGTYIVACLQRMNDEAMAGRLHGVYVIGESGDPYTKPRIYHSDGVQMELHMALVLGIPVFGQFHGDNEIDIHLLPVKDGKRLLSGGRFGIENWSVKTAVRHGRYQD